MALIDFITNMYSHFSSSIPEEYKIFVIICFYSVLIAVYAIFIWKFYRFLAKRDILELNLRKYNTTTHPVLNKLVASGFFLLEYVIILPLLILIWFAILSVFLLLLSSQNQEVANILLISASIVAAIRITSYFSEDLSKDLAKIFPFTVLGVFLLNPDFFLIRIFIERISEIPSLFGHIFKYLVFIFGVEILMRAIYVVIDLFSGGEVEGVVEVEEKK